MKAWLVTFADWPGSGSVVIAETKGKAIYRCWLNGLSDVYSFKTCFKFYRARRAPEHDTQEAQP